ncbi:hypothetical protein A9196_20195 [Aeromonas dhakensis]|nr:hypothetical protein A9196_20195 [Aeromonas dhakensis]
MEWTFSPTMLNRSNIKFFRCCNELFIRYINRYPLIDSLKIIISIIQMFLCVDSIKKQII